MIHALNLLWVVPLVVFTTIAIMSIFLITSSQNDDEYIKTQEGDNADKT